MDESTLLTWSQIKGSDESKLLNSSSYARPKTLHCIAAITNNLLHSVLHANSDFASAITCAIKLSIVYIILVSVAFLILYSELVM